MPEKEIQGHPAPPETKSWFEYSWKLRQDVPNRFEDAAKFLATIISLTITISFTALDKLKDIVNNPIWIFLVICIWLAALYFAFLVLYPHKYTFYSKSIESIKKAHEKIIREKQFCFIVSTILYYLSLIMLAAFFLISIIKS